MKETLFMEPQCVNANLYHPQFKVSQGEVPEAKGAALKMAGAGV